MESIKLFNYIIAIAFVVCYSYQVLYIIIPFFFRPRPHKETVFHNFAFLISARNESAVIGQLIDSIKAQKYPSDKVTVFVVADNCGDDTARIAQSHGAVVFERENHEQVGKGYALDYLLDRIKERYPDKPFDAFIVFDADNVLDENYLAEINKTFSDGYRIITSYRNSKNYGDNWISAGHSLWFMHESCHLNRSRMALGSSCAVSGTGFMFSREIIERMGGWKFHLLTEDIEFTIENVLQGERIGFCNDAVFYDEQPVKFSQSFVQRMRWAKGYLQVLHKYGKQLFMGIFRGPHFACYDMAMTIIPGIILTSLSVIVNGTFTIVGLLTKQNDLVILASVCEAVFNTYLTFFALGAVTTITEWKQINCSPIKKILYIFTFPVYLLTYIPISIGALFCKAEWKPIVHTVSVSVKDIRKKAKERDL